MFSRRASRLMLPRCGCGARLGLNKHSILRAISCPSGPVEPCGWHRGLKRRQPEHFGYDWSVRVKSPGLDADLYSQFFQASGPMDTLLSSLSRADGKRENGVDCLEFLRTDCDDRLSNR